MLVAILVILISTTGCSKKADSEHANTIGDSIGKAVANTALQVSETDVNAMSGQLKSSKLFVPEINTD